MTAQHSAIQLDVQAGFGTSDLRVKIRKSIWATDDATTRQLGGMGMQRMTVDTWLDLIEEEKELGTGHMLPAGRSPH